VTLLMPVGALLLGMAILGEHIHAGDFVGMALIGFGLMTIDGRLLALFPCPLAVGCRRQRSSVSDQKWHV